MLVETVYSASQLRDRFISMDRDYYSYEGYEAIFNYYEDYDEAIELDIIAICCDFNELTFEEFINDYSLEVEEGEDEEEAVINYLDSVGTWYKVLDDTVIYIVF